MMTNKVSDSLSSQMERYYQQMHLDRLVLRYKSFLEKKRLNNSFDHAEEFLQELRISEAELKALGIKSQSRLIIKITNTSLSDWY